jgi:2-oxoisovalerate dehydrogenase E1 component beta subunit
MTPHSTGSSAITPAAERPTRASMVSLAGALNSGLRRAMVEDPRVVVMGEDVGRLGGVFRITAGLQKEFGDERVFDSPLAEAGLVGVAVGMALGGYRPVVEIQFDGFIYPALNQICCHVARMPERLGGSVDLPIVIRVPVGGRIGATELHAESPEAYFAHTPDLRVVAASDPATAEALLMDAIRDPRPCIFLEPKRMYHRARVPAESVVESIEPDTARLVRPGSDVLLVSYGPAMDLALEAADSVAPEVETAVLDLVTLAPPDVASVVRHLQQTRGRMVVVTESIRRCSVAGDLVSRIATDHWPLLDRAPIVLSAPDRPYPAALFEYDYIPKAEAVAAALRRQAAS